MKGIYSATTLPVNVMSKLAYADSIVDIEEGTRLTASGREGWMCATARFGFALSMFLVLLWAGMGVAVAALPDNPCDSSPAWMNCTQGQTLAIAQAALIHYQQTSPEIGPYIAHYPAQPGSEAASYCVRWTKPSGCYFQLFYRARIFVEKPENPCDAPSTRNCTQAMALSIAKAAELYYLQRTPDVEAYVFHYAPSQRLYCVRWTQPAGCYFPVYYWEPVVDFDPSKNFGSEQCQAQTHCGNPINAGTGNKYQLEQDISSDALLGFVRHYNSDSAARSDGFGMHWTHSFSRRVEHVGTGGLAARVLRPEGGSVGFSRVDGAWSADADIASRLMEVLSPEGEHLGWTYYNAGLRETEEYDVLGRLIEVTDSAGRSLYFTYNEGLLEGNADDLHLTSVGQEDGRSLVLEYDEYHRVTKILDASGAEITYLYDATGRLEQVTFPGGATKRYLYNESAHTSGANLPWALTGIVDETGDRYATFKYASDRRAVSTEHAGGVDRFSIQYGSSGSASIATPSGKTQIRVFAAPLGVKKATSVNESCVGCVSRTMSYAYDANGRVDLVTDLDGTSSDYDYDANGLLSKRTEAANDSTGVKRTTETSWNSELRVPTERRAYNASGALVGKRAWTYNARGQALTSTQIDPATGATRRTTTTYCEQADVDAGTCPLLGLVTSTDGPRTGINDLTTYTYYPSDDASCATSPTTCPHRKGDLWKGTNALGQVTETLAYDGAGRVLSAKDANGVITDLEYHPRGWLIARKARGADGGSEADDAITRIEYEPTGLVKKVIQPDGAFTAYTYDAAHRLTAIADNSGNRIVYTLDNAGNRIKEDTQDGGGALRRTLSRLYNQIGQLQTAADADDNPTDFAYDATGNTDTVADALGRVTDNDYDPLNRLKRTLQDVAGIRAETKFQYDAQDNLTQVTDPKGLNTHYQYSGLGDLVQLTSPDTGVSVYTYDSAGNRKTSTDARGETATYAYDALNRLVGIGYSDAALNVTYTYDANQAICEAGETFAIGRLARLDDGSGSTQYCYDRRGNLVRKTQTTNGQVLTVRYAYTQAGRIASVTYPSGTRVDYAHNALGQPSAVNVTPAGGATEVLLSNVTYHPFGPAAEIEYGNGRKLKRTLNQNYQPATIEDTATDGLSLGFGFDAVGNLTALRTPAQSSVPIETFDYDALSRLTHVRDGPTGVAIEHYAYDATGNRTGVTTATGATAYQYPAESHRLVVVGAEGRTHDAAGNTTAIGGTAREFGYSAAGRMSQAKQAGNVVMNYAYNGRGEQVRRYPTAASAQTYAFYDEAGRVLGSYDSTGVRIQEVVWLDDLPVGVIASNQLHYVQADHLGTPRAVIDPVREKAVWQWRLAGEAFGKTVPNENPDGDAAQFIFDLRFPGQRYDAATGLNYNYFRDYEPGTGRYAQSDPAGLIDGPSTYGYVKQSPLSLIDTHGNSARPGPGYSFGNHKELARAEAIAKMQKCNLGECQGSNDPYAVSEADRSKVISKLISADIVLDYGEANCGVTEPNLDPHTITIGGRIFSGGCCSMAAALAHEAMHLVSADPFSVETEGRARNVQLRCFGCSTAYH